MRVALGHAIPHQDSHGTVRTSAFSRTQGPIMAPPPWGLITLSATLHHVLITPLSRPLSRLRKEISTGGNNRANCNAQYYENHSPRGRRSLGERCKRRLRVRVKGCVKR